MISTSYPPAARARRLVWLLAAALPAAPVWALGFGSAHGVQRVGRPFYAEVPLHSAESVSANCISVVPVPGEEAYFPADMSVTLDGRAYARRLVVSSRAAVREPLVVFQLRATCDAHLARDYTLIADAPARPESLPAEPVIAAPPLAARPVAARPEGAADETYAVSAPTTLNAMARALYPDDREARDRYRAAFAAANPELFAGIEHVGAVALARGTVLKRPSGLPLPAARERRTAPPAANNSATPGASAVPKPPAREPRGDHLSLGSAASQMKMLSDAILRLEQGQGERERLQGELVGAVSGAVTGIVELREHMRGQEADLKRLRGLLEQEQKLRESERSETPGLASLLALIFASGLVGASLMVLHHRLSRRRDGSPVVANTPTTTAAFSATPPHEPAAPAPAAAPPPADQAVQVMPPLVMVKAGREPELPKPTEASVSPRVPEPPAEPQRELGLDELMDSFQQHSAEVAVCVRQIRDSGTRDLGDWLNLVTVARTAGLLNDAKVVDMAREFRRMFNVDLDGSTEGSLESYPRVIKMLVADWGKRVGAELVESLIYDDRDGTRTGFPEAVAWELLLLRDLCRTRAEMFGFDGEAAPGHPFDGVDYSHGLDTRVDTLPPPSVDADGPRRRKATQAEREFAVEFDLGELKKPDEQ